MTSSEDNYHPKLPFQITSQQGFRPQSVNLGGETHSVHSNKTGEHLCVRSCMFSCSVVSDSVTPRAVALQAPLSMGFPRQEY